MNKKSKFVTMEQCINTSTDIKRGIANLEKQNDEILQTLRGDPREHKDLGLLGDVMEVKKGMFMNRRIIYGMIGVAVTMIISMLLMVVGG